MIEITVYTDGGCHPNPGGHGGWGYVMLKGAVRTEVFGHVYPSTNNRAEITAALKAIEASPVTNDVIHIHSDSAYLVNSMTKWIFGWRARDFKKGKEDMKNADLWRLMYQELQDRNLKFTWVKAHSGIEGNECADALATRGRLERPQAPVVVTKLNEGYIF